LLVDHILLLRQLLLLLLNKLLLLLLNHLLLLIHLLLLLLLIIRLHRHTKLATHHRHHTLNRHLPQAQLGAGVRSARSVRWGTSAAGAPTAPTLALVR